MVHRAASLRPPMPSEPERSRASRCLRLGPATFDRLGLGLLAVLDDVAGLEEDALGDLAPDRRPAQEELEVHAEVLELLALRVAHDRLRHGVGLDREALLVPADRLGLLGQRGAQAGKRSRLRPGALQVARGTGQKPIGPPSLNRNDLHTIVHQCEMGAARSCWTGPRLRGPRLGQSRSPTARSFSHGR